MKAKSDFGDDDSESLSSTLTASYGGDEKGRPSSSVAPVRTSAVSDDEGIDDTDISVKTHLDSVSSLPLKKKKKRRSPRSKPQWNNDDSEDCYKRSSVVRFDTVSNQQHEVSDEHEYDVEARWYQAKDYKKFKFNVVKIVKAVIHAQERAAKRNDPSTFSYSDTLEATYHACFQMELEVPRSNILTKQEQKCMARLFRNHIDLECTLGLERLLVQRIGKDRAELRNSLFHIVQDLQETARSSTTSWSPEVLSDNICQISEEVSRPARLFARHLALALQQAAAKDNTVAAALPSSNNPSLSETLGNQTLSAAAASVRRNSH